MNSARIELGASDGHSLQRGFLGWLGAVVRWCICHSECREEDLSAVRAGKEVNKKPEWCEEYVGVSLPEVSLSSCELRVSSGCRKTEP